MTFAEKAWYNSVMEQKFRPVLSVRIFGEEKCFGPGIAEILRRVQQEHSLRAAAMSMGMAYSKAWTVIKNAERELGFELLISSTGGKHGGGAILSDRAAAILTAYQAYRSKLQTFAEEEFAKGLAPLLSEEHGAR